MKTQQTKEKKMILNNWCARKFIVQERERCEANPTEIKIKTVEKVQFCGNIYDSSEFEDGRWVRLEFNLAEIQINEDEWFVKTPDGEYYLAKKHPDLMNYEKALQEGKTVIRAWKIGTISDDEFGFYLEGECCKTGKHIRKEIIAQDFNKHTVIFADGTYAMVDWLSVDVKQKEEIVDVATFYGAQMSRYFGELCEPNILGEAEIWAEAAVGKPIKRKELTA